MCEATQLQRQSHIAHVGLPAMIGRQHALSYMCPIDGFLGNTDHGTAQKIYLEPIHPQNIRTRSCQCRKTITEQM